MTNISIFVDSLCETEKYFNEDFEGKICENSSNITRFFLNNSEVFDSSCLNNEDFSDLVINLIFCDDEKIHEINKEYRKVDRPTDVISFALFADSPKEERFIFDGEINLGDVFLSLETTKRQAKENNNTFEKEFYYLISHSILHLLGFDHTDEITYDFMVTKQNEAIEFINV
jgi:probable rRNA maturation factor